MVFNFESGNINILMNPGRFVQVYCSAAFGREAEFVADYGRDCVGMPYERAPVEALLISERLKRHGSGFCYNLVHILFRHDTCRTKIIIFPSVLHACRALSGKHAHSEDVQNMCGRSGAFR